MKRLILFMFFINYTYSSVLTSIVPTIRSLVITSTHLYFEKGKDVYSLSKTSTYRGKFVVKQIKWLNGLNQCKNTKYDSYFTRDICYETCHLYALNTEWL